MSSLNDRLPREEYSERDEKTDKIIHIGKWVVGLTVAGIAIYSANDMVSNQPENYGDFPAKPGQVSIDDGANIRDSPNVNADGNNKLLQLSQPGGIVVYSEGVQIHEDKPNGNWFCFTAAEINESLKKVSQPTIETRDDNIVCVNRQMAKFTPNR